MADARLIDTYAARQYGVFNVRQLRLAGFDRDAVFARVRSGAWVRLGSGVYAVASAPPVWERQMSAAILSRPRAIVASNSAAHLHGFPGFGPARPVIMVPWSGNARSSLARVHRSTFFKTVATHRVKGFVVTSPAETIMTLAGELASPRLEAVLEDAVLAGLVRPTDFEEIFDRLAGTRVKGLAKLRPMVEERLPAASPVDASYLERLLQRLLAREEVPAHLREHPFELNGQRVRVDAFIPEWDIVVEADGRRWHTRNEDFESDRRRDNELLRRGVRVIRFTYAMLKDDFEGCLATLVESGTVARASRRE